MDVSKIIDGLQAGLKTIEKLSDVAKAVGVGGQVASLAGTLADIGNNVLDRIEEGTAVATERDVAVIRAINTEIAVRNDALAKAIAES